MEIILLLVTILFTISIIINIWQKLNNDSNEKFYKSEYGKYETKVRNLKYDIMNYQFNYLRDKMDEKRILRSKKILNAEQIAEKYIYEDHNHLSSEERVISLKNAIEEYVNLKLNEQNKISCFNSF